MKLFDRMDSDDEEEVRINASSNTPEVETEEEQETRLRGEVEKKINEDSGSSSDSGSSLPGMDFGGSDDSSAAVDLQDVHEQNKRIIGLLEEIKSEIGGSRNELL